MVSLPFFHQVGRYNLCNHDDDVYDHGDVHVHAHGDGDGGK